ncbi:MAG TPA: class I SAM-dependent methyltransferase [Pseudonocardiaceae bacterium]|jgi:caffeoyl-CoA O-methyltransferase|nr:class I SAM-dependent methyltransferase [Pseudonocardiaceae bacterium]
MRDVRKSIMNSADIHDYAVRHGRAADALLEELAETTRDAVPEIAHMSVPLEEAALLTFLVRLTGARSIVEVGMFTGSSTIALARGMPADGRLITCEIDARFPEISRPFFDRAGVASRVEVRLGPALDTLRALPRTPHLDLAFIDADKAGYISYWEEVVPRLRPGGLLIVDNTLFSGQVLAPEPGGQAAAVHAFNEHAFADKRVELVMVNVVDGITLVRKVDS